MKTLRHCAVLAFLVALCATMTFADEPGRHPAYLHALADLRHRLRTPLNHIVGYSELLLETTPPDNSVHVAVLSIKEAADRAASLTRQLLVFTRQHVHAAPPGSGPGIEEGGRR